MMKPPDMDESVLESKAFEIEPSAFANSDDDDTSASKYNILGDYLIFLMEHEGSLCEKNVPPERQSSMYSSLEIGAPIRSLCPDKRSLVYSRIK
jgi:hypothetical protein